MRRSLQADRWGAALLGAILAALTLSIVASAEPASTWELINPEGVVSVQPTQLNLHPETLQGKTVLLFWNGKHNGDNNLNRIEELLVAEVPGIRIFKSWMPPLGVPAGQNTAAAVISALREAGIRPDLVIASQAD